MSVESAEFQAEDFVRGGEVAGVVRVEMRGYCAPDFRGQPSYELE